MLKLESDDIKLLIISDAHLSSEEKSTPCDTEKSLIEVLDYCEEHSIHLLFLGDIFDYWMEYPNKIPNLAQNFRNRLSDFAKKSSPVIMITGNHDNWTRSYFESIGITLLHDELQLNTCAGKTLFLHGDGLKNSLYTFPRPLFHRILRNRLFIQFYQFIFPHSTGLRLMRWFSNYSRKRQRPDPSRLNEAAQQWITSQLADVVITGHDHVARKIKFEDGTYWNCGCFSSDKTALLYTNGVFNLVKWEHHHFVSYVQTGYTGELTDYALHS